MRTPLRRSGWLWIGALVVATVAGALILRSALTGHPHPASAQSPVATSPTPAATKHAQPSIPSEPPSSGPVVVPTSTPSDVSWSLFDGIALPSSPTAGPTRSTGAVHNGFTHDPEGALLADAQIAVRYLATPGTGWRDVLAEQIVPGPGVEAYSKARLAAGLGDVEHVDTTGVGQIVAFRFITYTPAAAVIQIVVRFPSSQYQVATNTVDWLDGDWKLQLLPDGSSASTVQTVNDLAGFVPWSGVSS